MFDRPTKMLVADDSQVTLSIFRDVTQRSCSLLNFVEVTNGRDCIRLLGRGDIDLAFIDIHMPEMSGLDALRGARHVGIKTFVTLMSGDKSRQFRPLARELKAYEFLIKPFDVRDVESVIRTYRRAMQATSVLVIDSSTTVRKIVRKVLDGSIFRMDCYEATDGETALAHCRRTGFDVVFLDCTSHGAGGLATLDRLLLLNGDAKIVAVTNSRKMEAEAMRRGAAAVLGKPFSSGDVDAVLHCLFGLSLPGLADLGEVAVVAGPRAIGAARRGSRNPETRMVDRAQ
jgi:CheY-like chemotaxis protein